MNKERLVLIDELFDKVVDLPPDEQQRFLDKACAGDDALKHEVLQLLKADEDATTNNALEKPFTKVDTQHLSSPLAVNEQLGPYQILKSLGRGGMGQVFLAQRNDNTFKSLVAIKVIRRGMDTEDVLKRFRMERQILASLNHPNIAKVLDGGVTPSGLSYFVMEYVDGIPITTYCDKNNLSIKERIALFTEVCEAVYHAHQNLIVHRDLKPSNILVTQNGKVKLLDFGIAKILNPNLVGYTLPITQIERNLLTPSYASPEQIKGDSISTASDIYTLGVLLYELLTGHQPFDLHAKTQNEIFKVVAESVPQRPSSVVLFPTTITESDGSLRTYSVEDIGNARSVGVEQLKKVLKGDLDNIIMKALRKEPTLRYASVERLADDLKRYLEGLPVLARKASYRYRMQKFIQRNKIVSAFLFIITALLIGLGTVISIQSYRLSDALERSENASSFIFGLFNRLAPQHGQSNTISVDDILKLGIEQIDADLKDQPMLQNDLRRQLATIYSSFGELDKAIPLFETVYQYHKNSYGETYPETASVLSDLGWSYFRQGDVAKGEKMMRQALSILKNASSEYNEPLANTLNNLGYISQSTGGYDEAETMFKQSIKIRESLFGNADIRTLESKNSYAFFLYETGNLEEAEPLLKETIAMQRQLFGNRNRELALALHNLASLYISRRESEKAKPLFEESLAIRRSVFGDSSATVALTLDGLGLTYLTENKIEEGSKYYTEALAIRRAILKPNHPAIALSLSNMGGIHMNKGEFEKAEPYYRESLSINRALQDANNPRVASVLDELGRVVLELNRPQEAKELLEEAYEIRKHLYGITDIRTAYTALNIGKCYMVLRQFEKSEQFLLEGNNVMTTENAPESWKKRALNFLLLLYTEWNKPEQVATYQNKLEILEAEN